MNTERLQQNLAAARRDLLAASASLHIARVNKSSRDVLVIFERMFCHYLDRAWEAQCMADGVGWGR